MLVLTRKVGESIRVGKDIHFFVVSCNRGRVTVGIEAPRHLQVSRDESWSPAHEGEQDTAPAVPRQVQGSDAS